MIVGAGLAGWRVAESLRREGFTGRVTLVGDEPDPPYDRPPLSKKVLSGQWGLEMTTLATAERAAAEEVILRLGVAATGLDVATTTVTLADGSAVMGTRVVVATGSRARRLGYRATRHLHYLRSRADARALLADLDVIAPESSVAVIGGGFIGAEVATSLAARGLRPVIFEAGVRPLHYILGPQVSQWLERLPGDVGVELRNEQTVRDIVDDGSGITVELSDGELHAAAVVVGVGALPNVEWLEGSALSLSNGVVVDEHLQAAHHVAAVGDVARFPWHGLEGDESVRLEHWEVANSHALALSRHWTGGRGTVVDLVPYFWSDQYGKKIQMLGHPRTDDEVERVEGDSESGRWLALYHRRGTVTGVVGLSHPRAVMLSRSLLEEPTDIARALASSPWST